MLIETQRDYKKALADIEVLMDRNPAPGTTEAEKLKLLMLLIKDYEDKNFPAELPSYIDAILFRMEQKGLIQRDLVPYLGSRSRVSEILAGKRPLTLSMIRALHEGLGIPIKALIQPLKSSVVHNFKYFKRTRQAERQKILAANRVSEKKPGYGKP